MRIARFSLAALLLAAAPALAADLKQGTPDLKSAGPLAFGPKNVLFIGDAQSAAIFAVEVPDKAAGGKSGSFKVEGIDKKIAEMLGTTPQEIVINDLAVNPNTGDAYLSVSRGRGNSGKPVIVRVDSSGRAEELALKDVKFAKAELPSPPSGNKRLEAITDLAYVDGRVFVAGLSNEEFSSKLRAIPYPFTSLDEGTSVEIFHGAHGRFETASPVRTFIPYTIGGEPYILAAYTCTPLVKFKVSDLKPGVRVKGTTVAELGNRNKPLDMVAYQKDGKEYLLLANSSRGTMKVTTEGIDTRESITKPVQGTAGQTYETISSLKGVEQLDQLDKSHGLVLIRSGDSLNLESIELP